MIWIDAIHEKVEMAKQRGIPHIYEAVVSNKEGEQVVFHIANNGQSSSLLEFGTHSSEHPQVSFVEERVLTTTTIDAFFSRTPVDPSVYSFWNIDLQGAELMALQGGEASLSYATALYLEINVNELYQGCALLPELDSYLEERGFRRIRTEMTTHGWGDALYLRFRS